MHVFTSIVSRIHHGVVFHPIGANASPCCCENIHCYLQWSPVRLECTTSQVLCHAFIMVVCSILLAPMQALARERTSIAICDVAPSVLNARLHKYCVTHSSWCCVPSYWRQCKPLQL